MAPGLGGKLQRSNMKSDGTMSASKMRSFFALSTDDVFGLNDEPSDPQAAGTDDYPDTVEKPSRVSAQAYTQEPPPTHSQAQTTSATQQQTYFGTGPAQSDFCQPSQYPQLPQYPPATPAAPTPQSTPQNASPYPMHGYSSGNTVYSPGFAPQNVAPQVPPQAQSSAQQPVMPSYQSSPSPTATGQYQYPTNLTQQFPSQQPFMASYQRPANPTAQYHAPASPANPTQQYPVQQPIMPSYQPSPIPTAPYQVQGYPVNPTQYSPGGYAPPPVQGGQVYSQGLPGYVGPPQTQLAYGAPDQWQRNFYPSNL